MKLLSLILFMAFTQVSWAAYSDTFMIKIFDRRVTVLAPDKMKNTMSVIIENKTLVPIRGKLVTKEGVIDYVSIPPSGDRVVNVSGLKVEEMAFISMAPAFQEIELKVGKKLYEIPPKE